MDVLRSVPTAVTTTRCHQRTQPRGVSNESTATADISYPDLQCSLPPLGCIFNFPSLCLPPLFDDPSPGVCFDFFFPAWKPTRVQLAGPHMLSTQVQALVREYFADVGTPFRRHLRRDIIAVR